MRHCFFTFIFLLVSLVGNSQSRDELFKQAQEYHLTNQQSKAIAIYDYAIQIDSLYPESYFFRGIALHESNDIPNALEDFNKTISLNSNNADAYHYRAQCKRQLKDSIGAINEDQCINLWTWKKIKHKFGLI